VGSAAGGRLLPGAGALLPLQPAGPLPLGGHPRLPPHGVRRKSDDCVCVCVWEVECVCVCGKMKGHTSEGPCQIIFVSWALHKQKKIVSLLDEFMFDHNDDKQVV